MNYAKIKSYITQYRQDFEKVRNQEIYKWKAVKSFQDNWNPDSPDFTKMLDKSLDLAKNLLDSGQYFPKRMLIRNASINPNETTMTTQATHRGMIIKRTFRHLHKH
jgi:hypothetical protein